MAPKEMSNVTPEPKRQELSAPREDEGRSSGSAGGTLWASELTGLRGTERAGPKPEAAQETPPHEPQATFARRVFTV